MVWCNAMTLASAILAMIWFTEFIRARIIHAVGLFAVITLAYLTITGLVTTPMLSRTEQDIDRCPCSWTSAPQTPSMECIMWGIIERKLVESHIFGRVRLLSRSRSLVFSMRTAFPPFVTIILQESPGMVIVRAPLDNFVDGSIERFLSGDTRRPKNSKKSAVCWHLFWLRSIGDCDGFLIHSRDLGIRHGQYFSNVTPRLWAKSVQLILRAARKAVQCASNSFEALVWSIMI